jgi:hypothetical protein
MSQKDDDQKAILDAAEIINLCAQHQKRIVDDLLTLSKLDAKLLVIAPENVDPINIIEKMLQMYQAELRKADITVNLVVDQTLNDMAICEVIFDPGRFLQVRKHLSDSNAQIYADQIGAYQHFHKCDKIHDDLSNTENHNYAICFVRPPHNWTLRRIICTLSMLSNR